MHSFPKLTPNGWDGLVVVAIVALAVVCSLGLMGQESDDLVAVVSIAGDEVQSLSLDDGDGDYAFTAGDYHLTLTLSQGEAWVSHADCPTQDCVRTGHISSAGQSIVCLPGKLSVRLLGNTADGVDVVVG